MTRVAVVTGAGSGIGSAAALALAREGWSVVLAGRRPGPLAALVAEHRHLDLLVCPTDVTDETSVRRLFDTAVSSYGRLDLLFNNAGAFSVSRPIDEVPLAEWQAMLDVNLTGVFLCTREAFRVMRHQDPRGGRIINNGSVSAYVPRPRSAAYSATKHAVSGLTKVTALDGRAHDIACGQIDVGNAATGITQAMTDGILQPDGSTRSEPVMDLAAVADAVVYMAGLPLGANVATMTVMATRMPYLGRG